jgi:hypothetical protein
MQQRGILLDLLIIKEVGHMVDLLHTVDMAKMAKGKVDTIEDLITRVHHHAPRTSQGTNSPSWKTSESWLS